MRRTRFFPGPEKPSSTLCFEHRSCDSLHVKFHKCIARQQRYYGAKPRRIAELPRTIFGHYLDIVATGRGTDDTVLDRVLVNA